MEYAVATIELVAIIHEPDLSVVRHFADPLKELRNVPGEMVPEETASGKVMFVAHPDDAALGPFANKARLWQDIVVLCHGVGIPTLSTAVALVLTGIDAQRSPIILILDTHECV